LLSGAALTLVLADIFRLSIIEEMLSKFFEETVLISVPKCA
jgi:hypothetical protein